MKEKVAVKVEKAVVTVTATYSRDSKRYHLYVVDEGQGFVGSIYVPKENDVPLSVTVTLITPTMGA